MHFAPRFLQSFSPSADKNDPDGKAKIHGGLASRTGSKSKV
jgi:hypothetical protein